MSLTFPETYLTIFLLTILALNIIYTYFLLNKSMSFLRKLIYIAIIWFFPVVGLLFVLILDKTPFKKSIRANVQ